MTEPEHLSALLELLEQRGVQVSAIVMGDLKLVLAAPWPPTKAPVIPIKPQVAEVMSDRQARPSRLTPEQLEKARAASRQTFGRVLPDEQLEDFAEAGLL